jgi:hypothetical protein
MVNKWLTRVPSYPPERLNSSHAATFSLAFLAAEYLISHLCPARSNSYLCLFRFHTIRP